MSNSKQLQINKRPKDDLSDEEEEKRSVYRKQGDEKKKGKAARITLGHWQSQGPASAARMMLVFGDVDFENVMYEATATEDGYDVSSWTKAKFNLDLDFPNLPYLIDNKTGLKLTASKSIYRYLAKQFAIGVQDDGNMAIADMVQEMIGEVMGAPFTVLSYGDFSGKSSDELWAENKAKYLEELPSLLKDVEGFMANKKFVTGHQISYADFSLYYLCLTHNALDPEFSKRFPNLSAFGARFGALEGMERWHCTEMSRLPFNNVMAHFGSTWQAGAPFDGDKFSVYWELADGTGQLLKRENLTKLAAVQQYATVDGTKYAKILVNATQKIVAGSSTCDGGKAQTVLYVVIGEAHDGGLLDLPDPASTCLLVYNKASWDIVKEQFPSQQAALSALNGLKTGNLYKCVIQNGKVIVQAGTSETSVDGIIVPMKEACFGYLIANKN